MVVFSLQGCWLDNTVVDKTMVGIPHPNTCFFFQQTDRAESYGQTRGPGVLKTFFGCRFAKQEFAL